MATCPCTAPPLPPAFGESHRISCPESRTCFRAFPATMRACSSSFAPIPAPTSIPRPAPTAVASIFPDPPPTLLPTSPPITALPAAPMPSRAFGHPAPAPPPRSPPSSFASSPPPGALAPCQIIADLDIRPFACGFVRPSEPSHPIRAKSRRARPSTALQLRKLRHVAQFFRHRFIVPSRTEPRQGGAADCEAISRELGNPG